MNNTYIDYKHLYITIEYLKSGNQKEFNFYSDGIDNKKELINQVKDWIFPVGTENGMSEYKIIDSHYDLEYFIPILNQHEIDFTDSIKSEFWLILENLIDGHIDIEQAIALSQSRKNGGE